MKTDDMNTDKELDDLLNTYSVSPASLGLQQRILQVSRKPSPWAELLAVLGGWQIAGPALAASILCGVATQLWWDQAATDVMTGDSVWALAMLDETQEWTYE
ncbi:MAG: hypothetical protein ACSHWQ_07040 [Spongiibacteraceae bacterium]